MYTKDELEELAKVFEKHPQLFILSDELYEYINYAHDGGGGHQSIAQFDAIKDQGNCFEWPEQRICDDRLEAWLYCS